MRSNQRIHIENNVRQKCTNKQQQHFVHSSLHTNFLQRLHYNPLETASGKNGSDNLFLKTFHIPSFLT